ncbi:MAG: thioredoxin family protein [Chitinophagaceae bacterium]
MKNKIFFLFLLLGIGFRSFSQETYHTSYDSEGNKVLTGYLSESVLANDSAFQWFFNGVNDYHPDPSMVRYIAANKDHFQVVVLGGTWCPDTQKLLPEFYRVMIGAGYPLNKIMVIGVDHHLKAIGNETRPYHLVQTPTFIFYRNGKELGRIVDHVHKSMEADMVAILQGQP